MTRVDWSRLPDDLLRRIVENYMATVEDYVMFSCVCRSWFSVTRDSDRSELRKKWTRQMPLLMLTDGNTEIYDIMKKGRSDIRYKSLLRYDVRRLFNVQDCVKDYDLEIHQYHPHSDEDEDNDGEDTNATRCMLNLSGGKNTYYKANLPEAYGRSCWGSRYGWIVNPLTKATLPLPSQWTFPFPWKGASGKTVRWTFMDRAVLLLVPRDNGCHSHISRDSPCSANDHNDGIWLVVVLHHGGILASIAKPGDSSWTPILRRSSHDNNFTILEDVTYCTRLRSLLFVDFDTKLYICDLRDIEHPQVLRPYFKGGKNWMEKPSKQSSKIYFVESGGETLIITRYIMPRSHVDYYKDFKIEDYGEFEGQLTFNFRVHKMKSKKLKEIHELGKVALFVGRNAAISVCSKEVGCEANCIYYCDDYQHPPTNGLRGHDMGIFKMNDRTIRPFYN